MKFLVTSIIVSYKSKWIIENCIKSIKKKNKIIVIENSNDYELKKNLEKKYNNIKVILNKNNGFGHGANLGALNANTKYLLFLGPDTSLLKNNSIERLIQIAENFDNNFGAILPVDYREKINEITEIKKSCHGTLIFIKKDIFLKIGSFDENFFLYYEDNDLLERLLKKKLKIYKVPIKFKHFGRSHDKKHNEAIEINRNWHLMWSKFNFYKKNKNYLFAFFFLFPTLIRCSFKVSLNYFFNYRKYLIYKARLSGLVNSYCHKKSWYRPRII